MKFSRSISDQNLFFTYVCLVSEVKPNRNDEIAMDRDNIRSSTQTANADTDKEIGSTDKLELLDDISGCVQNTNNLKPKINWLTENQEDASDSSSRSISPSSSSYSVCSRESEGTLNPCISSGDKCLSTILRLDKEHNIFGLSNIAIVGTRMSRKIRKENEKPAFPQTAIVQVCCGRKCCKHKSNTDLPSSLKCGGCHSSCFDPYCSKCTDPQTLLRDDLPYSTPCSSCARIKCTCKVPCRLSKCKLDCTTRYGMKILLKRKPKYYEPSPIELTPRSSCVLLKPLAARSCHHVPQCIPPSSCFPYLMPCYWPARAGAPCSHPSRCFHNPPCRPPRIRKVPIPVDEMCSKEQKCTDEKKKMKCPNIACLGNNPSMKEAIESRFGVKNKK